MLRTPGGRPDESDIKGSTAAFMALHKSMLQRGRLALCRYKRFKTTPPVLVALVAQEAVVDPYLKTQVGCVG